MKSARWSHPVPRIGEAERLGRLSRLRATMASNGLAGVLLGSTPSLRYFTGLVWHQSERFLGALVTEDRLTYIVPGFEQSRVETLPSLPGDIAVWEEDEDSVGVVSALLGERGRLAVDDALPLFHYYPLLRALGAGRLGDAGALLHGQRMRKSEAEIALIQCAMDLTLDVQKAAHAMMRPGVRASEVVAFIDGEHRRKGADNGSTFCIVSFGAATSLPHGAEQDQVLAKGDVILVDTGCQLDGYQSDLTRTYCIDPPDAEFARLWSVERDAQQAVLEAAELGATCASLDAAARRVIEAAGLGPDYRLPGLPHRAGHGLGLEVHEHPYIVRGNATRLEAGMCFSNEPMIVIPGSYGIRLEDHIHITAAGPSWFTLPSRSPTEPFG
jgi:Xaa-Pro dipeptidase